MRGVMMRLSAGSTVEGRLTFEGADPPEDPELRLSAVPADPDLDSLLDNPPARADIHADLTFEIGGLNGRAGCRLTKAPDGWTLKQVLVNGGDATDLPLPFGTRDQSLRDVEVVLTRQVDDRHGLGAATRPIARPTSGSSRSPSIAARRYTGSRFIAVGVPGRDGTATLHGLPPGDYYVAAIESQRLRRDRFRRRDGDLRSRSSRARRR